MIITLCFETHHKPAGSSPPWLAAVVWNDGGNLTDPVRFQHLWDLICLRSQEKQKHLRLFTPLPFFNTSQSSTDQHDNCCLQMWKCRHMKYWKNACYCVLIDLDRAEHFYISTAFMWDTSRFSFRTHSTFIDHTPSWRANLSTRSQTFLIISMLTTSNCAHLLRV